MSVFFIIKRIPVFDPEGAQTLEREGTGGSVAICDQVIGHTMQAW